MKSAKENHYSAHLLICLNEKAEGKACCQQKLSPEFVKNLKLRAKEKWKGQVRVNASRCLGRCSEGGIAVLYPQGIWFTELKENDLESLWQKLLEVV